MAAAQSPKTQPWAKNEAGPRTLAEALDVVRAQGLEIPDDVRFIIAPAGILQNDVYAQYGAFVPTKTYEWEELLTGPEDARKVPVKINPSVLESDEAILAVFAHELFEIEGLRACFEQSPRIAGQMLCNEVCSGRPNNLHDRAWDEADKRVAAFRRT